ncbi:MAG TPA: thioredoxin family protein [Lutibacter sp.]|nr:thioredoxin family protein [Lutibacter sp.]
MRKTFSLLALLFTAFAFAQIGDSPTMVDPIRWSHHVEKISDTEYDLVVKATIEKEWHLYSQHNPDGASLPIEFWSEQADSLFTFEGKALESPTEKAYNDTFKKEEIFFSHHAMLKQRIKLKDANTNNVEITIYGQACKEACIQLEETFKLDLSKATTDIEPMPVAKVGENHEESTDTDGDKKKSKGLWMVFFLSFLGGFAALLTPCVFPMIPMTVSFFMKQSKSKAAGIKNAIVYGLSIIAIYVAIGSLVTGVFGADAMNEFSTSVEFNLAFFLILIVFAFSFLGGFEIMLPSSWGTKVDEGVDKKGGYVGIFLMALALAIVSFSCTLPIVGTALAASASTGGIGPIISMLGFSIALALPFTLFAMFPGWLNAMPKSGGWLNTVKVFLGFLELAFAFKFLSNADLVLDLHWFEREAFIAIWIAVFGALAFYLFGKIKLPHDDDSTRISVGRFSLGLIALAFTLYLIPGMFGAPLKLISGFPPPLKYAESPYGVGFSKRSNGGSATKKVLPEGAHLGPHDIVSFEDYDLGMAYAKKVNKPVMIDFTGKACVNCRKMEDYVWADPKVLNVLDNDIVLISLYVDYKEKLPKEEQYTSEITGKKIRTVGNKWSEFQTVRYKTNTQPYYVLLNQNEEELNTPYAYNSDVKAFYNWLKEGVSKH